MTDIAVPRELVERAVVLLRPYETTDSRVATQLAALLPKPDEARELLANALDWWSTANAEDIRGGEPSWDTPVAVIRTALDRKPKMTAEVADDLDAVKQWLGVNCPSPILLRLKRIAFAFEDQTPLLNTEPR